MPSWIRKALFLLVPLTVAVAVLAPNIQHVRREAQVKRTLLTIQHALQDFHVDKETYVPKMEMTGGELISLLKRLNFLKEPVLNPYTGRDYALDGKETDRIRYRTDEAFETYALQALHFDRNDVWLEIDSVQHQSLE